MNEELANTLVAEGLDYFNQKYNCSQSTFVPFAHYLGLDIALAFKLATPFAGGLGHRGEVCGAVCGALMALGVVKGNAVVDREKKHACYDMAAKFQDRFINEHGSVQCPKLLGLDISDPDQLQEARERGLFTEICPAYIETAIRLMVDILDLE